MIDDPTQNETPAMPEANAEASPEVVAEESHAAASGKAGMFALVGIAVLIPVLYLVLHRKPAEAATTQAPAAAPAVPLAALEQAAAQSPTVDNRLNLSLGYINAGQPGRAEDVLHKLLAQAPGEKRAWNNLCVAQVQLRELGEAPASCQRALAIDPNFQLAKNNLKWATDVRQAEEATLAKLEETSPGSRDAKFFLAEGNQYLHLGEYDKAINSWQRMLLQSSNDPVAANNIGTAFMMKHQPAEAKTWFAKAEAWDPNLQLAKNNMAWAEQELAAQSH